MDARDKVLAALAEREGGRIARGVIRKLQRMTEGMQSGADTILRNLWDEVCVQVQGQESVIWDTYLDTIDTLIQESSEKLSKDVKQAIWLQTSEGEVWLLEGDLSGDVPYTDEGIRAYILHEFVLPAAADWNNARIEKYKELMSG